MDPNRAVCFRSSHAIRSTVMVRPLGPCIKEVLPIITFEIFCESSVRGFGIPLLKSEEILCWVFRASSFD